MYSVYNVHECECAAGLCYEYRVRVGRHWHRSAFPPFHSKPRCGFVCRYVPPPPHSIHVQQHKIHLSHKAVVNITSYPIDPLTQIRQFSIRLAQIHTQKPCACRQREVSAVLYTAIVCGVSSMRRNEIFKKFSPNFVTVKSGSLSTKNRVHDEACAL